MVPLLSEALSALPRAAEVLAALGVFGCEAARHLGALTAQGGVAACSFFSVSSPTRVVVELGSVEAPGSLGSAKRPAEPSEPGTTTSPSSTTTLAGLPVLGASGDLAVIWDEDAGLARLRAYHAAPPEPCRSCALLPVCRGGCQVVSRRATGGFAPDPECPQVLRLRTAVHEGGSPGG
jgi:hypothetical protein